MIRGSGLPLQGVAAWCETSRNTIWRLVHGRTKHPDLRLIRKIRKLADMSGCSPISRDQLEKMHSAAVVEAEQQKAEDRRRAARAASSGADSPVTLCRSPRRRGTGTSAGRLSGRVSVLSAVTWLLAALQMRRNCCAMLLPMEQRAM